MNENNNVILELKDGGIVGIDTDEYSYAGCETCDYGSEYISELNLTLANSGKLHVELNQMYEYALSIGDTMQMFLKNIKEIQEKTELEFVNWFFEYLKSKVGVCVIDKFKLNEVSYIENK